MHRPATENSLLSLSKPFRGKPVCLSALLKGNIIQSAQMEEPIHWMSTLNGVGEKLGAVKGVTAITDITGFGFLGHLVGDVRGQPAVEALISPMILFL
jgi:selenide,water dikinase